jgi:hypothetical protein
MFRVMDNSQIDAENRSIVPVFCEETVKFNLSQIIINQNYDNVDILGVADCK